MKTKITTQEKLQLLGLFTLANQHAKKVQEAERAMADLLEHDDPYVDHLSDEAYNDAPDFNGALKRMGIEVKDD